MIKKSDREKEIGALFRQGYNCAQAIRAEYGKKYGLKREHTFRVGAPFGGGIADTGDICSAVTGSLMVIGLSKGDIKPESRVKKAKLYRTSRTFMEQFSSSRGSLTCCDIREHMAGRRGDVVRDSHCASVVKTAICILEEPL
ncbi:MAG: C_GCAxxG_C_C family protein [Nitrospiraceae bacterium]|nr:MAG: C_GCAxxG_C_C family protein [Nitrospiraceae bacterium]